MERRLLRNVITAWMMFACVFFCYMPAWTYADADITYGDGTDNVKDVNYQSILGDAMEYGVVADTFRQQNHTQTNFAVCEYVRGGDQLLEADLLGEGNIPFIIGKMENKIRFGQHTYNNQNVTMDIVTSDAYKGEEGTFIRDNKERVTVNANYESESSVKSRVAKLQNHVAEWSKKLAAKKGTVVLSKTMRGNTIDLTRYDEDAVIYVDVPADGNFLTEVVDHNLTIQKKSNQIVVFNIPNQKVSLKEFTVVADGETVHSQTSQSNTNQKVDQEILRKVIWNMPNAETVNLKDNAGMFLVPKDTATVNMDGGAVGGWLVTGGTLNGNAEWHFMFQARKYNGQPGKPENPEEPDKPSTPETPEEPDTPSMPETPEKPDTPNMPETPETPDKPDTPSTPENPDEPSTPNTPENPDHPKDSSTTKVKGIKTTTTTKTKTPSTVTPAHPNVPDTGDTSQLPLYVVLAAAGIAGLGIIEIRRRKI